MSTQPCPLHDTLQKNSEENNKRLVIVDANTVKISCQIEALSQRFDRHGQEIKNLAQEMSKQVEQFSKVLYGDGEKPGIISKVTNHEDWITKRKNDWSTRVNIVYQVLMSGAMGFLLFIIQNKK